MNEVAMITTDAERFEVIMFFARKYLENAFPGLSKDFRFHSFDQTKSYYMVRMQMPGHAIMSILMHRNLALKSID